VLPPAKPPIIHTTTTTTTNMGSPSGSSPRVDLARPLPVQHSTIEKDLHSEELSQFKKAVADWAVGAGFNVMMKKSDKYVLLSHLSTTELSAHRTPTAIGSARSLYVR